MISDNYTKSVISNLETELDKIHSSIPNNVEVLLSSGYKPEIDSSRELNPMQINFFQGLIGMLHWILN